MPAVDVTDEWRDLWSEYRMFFAYYKLDKTRAATVVYTIAARMARPNPDRVADALKEFALRAQQRDVPAHGLLRQLRRAICECGDSFEDCQRLFGVAAEDLGQQNCISLAEMVAAKEA